MGLIQRDHVRDNILDEIDALKKRIADLERFARTGEALDVDGAADFASTVDIHSTLDMNSADIENVDQLDIERVIKLECYYSNVDPASPPAGSLYLYARETTNGTLYNSLYIKFSDGTTYAIKTEVI